MSTVLSEIRLRIRAEGDKVLVDLGAKLNDIANKATLSSNNFKGLAAELKQVQATTVQSTKNIKDYSASWRELAGSVDIASKEFKQATAEAARLDAQLAKAQGTRSRGGRLAGAAQTVGTIAAAGVFGGPEGVVGAGIGAAVGGPMGAAVGGAIGAQAGMARQALGATGEYVAELSKLQIALSGVSKDQADFEKNLSSITRLSNQFLIPLKDTTQQYTKLQASVVGAGMQSKVTETVFKGISAATLATGGSIEDLNASLRATAQVFSKGKVSAEELRQQIGERLPGAFTIFASSIGKTPQELDKALEDGKVTLEDFEKFSKELFKRYGKTAEIIAQAPQNAGARLALELDKITKVVGRLTQPIGAAFQSLGAEIVKGLAPALESLANLIDAPKQLASERLKQLDRQLAQENQALLESRNYSKTLREGPSVFGEIAAQEQKMRESRIKTLKAERLLNLETAKQTGAAVDEVKLQKKLEEDRKVTSAREKALISLRELEQKTINDLADLREKQIKRALDLERQIIDQRLKAERDLQDARKETQYSQEDFQFGSKLIQLREAGQSTDSLEVSKAAGEVTRNLQREVTQLQRTREDEAQQRQKTLENFKKTNAEEVGRIQLNYTRQSGNIIEKAGDSVQKSLQAGTDYFVKGLGAEMKIFARTFYRAKLGLAPEDLTQAPDVVLPPPTQAPRSQIQQFIRKPNDQPNQLANSAAAGVGRVITPAMTRLMRLMVPGAQSMQIDASPFRRVETASQGLGRTQEAKNTQQLNKANIKSLIEYQKIQDNILKPLDDQKILLGEQLKDRGRINKMIDSGTLPAMAQEYLQIEKSGEKRKEGLIGLRDEINANVELNNLSKVDLENRDKLLLSINQQIQGIDAAVAATKGLVISVSPLQEFIKQGSTELRNLEGVAVTVSQGIGSAVSNSVSSGIQGLVEGTANAQQIFSDFLKSIGQILIQEGAKMIATYTAIAIAKSLAGLFGGGNTVPIDQGGSGMLAGNPLQGFDIPTRATGGPVSSNSTYMVGEKGPELFVPRTSGTIVPADATAAAMARYQRQGGSSGGSSSSDAMGADAATPVLSMSFETTRFLGQDYVSTDQLQAAMMATEKRAASAGAKAGAAQVSSQMRNSPAYRRQVGLR
jgi:tape measure domain-containing protein